MYNPSEIHHQKKIKYPDSPDFLHKSQNKALTASYPDRDYFQT